MMVMRPHVASTILNHVNHQVSEGCFTGNPPRTAVNESVCHNQIHISERTTNSSNSMETLTSTRARKTSSEGIQFILFPQETPASKEHLIYQRCSPTVVSQGVNE